MDMSLSKRWETVEDRELGRAAVHGAAEPDRLKGLSTHGRNDRQNPSRVVLDRHPHPRVEGTRTAPPINNNGAGKNRRNETAQTFLRQFGEETGILNAVELAVHLPACAVINFRETRILNVKAL